MKKEYIALSDADGNVAYYDAQDLALQLVHTELSAGASAAKAAAKALAIRVHEMRQAQKTLKRLSDTVSDPVSLAEAKAKVKEMEGKVDATIPVYLQTIEKV